MSYCRWSKGESDVYVYEDVSGGFTCCGCTLEKWEMETETDRPGFNALTQADMVRHLERHRVRGDIVPQVAIDRLVAELEGRM